MAVKAIVDKILAAARVEAEKIAAEAKAQAQAIVAQAQAEADRERDRLLAHAKPRAEQEASQILSAARLQTRDALLRLKQDQIDRAFAVAYERLGQLRDELYLPMLLNLLETAHFEGEQEMLVNARDRQRLTNDFLRQANERLAGKGTVLLAGETAEIDGGFLLRQDRKQINCSLTSARRWLREEMERKVARTLFPDEKG